METGETGGQEIGDRRQGTGDRGTGGTGDRRRETGETGGELKQFESDISLYFQLYIAAEVC